MNVFRFVLLMLPFFLNAQTSDWRVKVRPLAWEFPGIQTYSMGHVGTKWLFLGGRRDGIHGILPTTAYEPPDRNAQFIVLDIATGAYYTAEIPSFWPIELRDFLMSASQEFAQRNDTLFVAGGYGYSAALNTKITFPYIAAIDLTATIQAITEDVGILPQPQYSENNLMAVCGGRMELLDGRLNIVGGHKFDGAYNNLGQATFTQEYTHQVRRFDIESSDTVFQVINFETPFTDLLHMRRRDYNLVPQVYADGTRGLTVFSGVFQPDHNFPYLYPVHITSSGHTVQTAFLQYLSNYHCATIPLWDAPNNEMHTLFLGGMSRYHYKEGVLVEDTLIPFVSTISLVTRNNADDWTEFVLSDTLPGYLGSGAEFIPAANLPLDTDGKMVLFDQLSTSDSVLLGYMVGGLRSNYGNPFTNNDIFSTVAAPTVFEIWLQTDPSSSLNNLAVDGKNPLVLQLNPNPIRTQVLQGKLDAPQSGNLYWFVQNAEGQMITKGKQMIQQGEQVFSWPIDKLPNGVYQLTTHIDGRSWTTQQFIQE